MSNMSDYYSTTNAQHDSGVHVHCTPARRKVAGGWGTADNCVAAKSDLQVEQIHYHDFDGPLPGCCNDGLPR